MKTHRYKVDDEVTTVTGAKGKVLELLPAPGDDGEPYYKVQTEVGKATWGDHTLV